MHLEFMSRKDKLKGIVVSLPTPVKENYEVDYDKFKEHVNWLIEEGMVEGEAVLMGAGGDSVKDTF